MDICWEGFLKSSLRSLILVRARRYKETCCRLLMLGVYNLGSFALVEEPANILKNLGVQKGSPESGLTLKPNSIDWLSAKVQLVLSAVCSLIVCLLSWSQSLNVGFLLDDYLHLDYISRAFNGDWNDFFHNFYGNWANSPAMRSYRPLVSLSLLLDYSFWHSNPFGFHLTNLLLLWGSCLMVSLITLELTGLKGNRLSAVPSIWAALLFAVYPLHLEAAAWIIGRVDLLCTFFYLLSIFTYFRFRLLREKFFLSISLASFLAAMLSKEMAVTLPLVIFAFEIFLAPLLNEKQSAQSQAASVCRRPLVVLSYFFVMGAFSVIRMMALGGQMIGGYGSVGLESLQNFLDGETLERILFPVNIDLVSRTDSWAERACLGRVLKVLYLFLLGFGILRLLTKTASLRIFSFLFFWMIVSVLPAFQIWHISPNLVGERLFYMGSAPFSVLLVFLALPAIDVIKAFPARLLTTAGAIVLSLIVCVWSYWLCFDMRAWTGAALLLNKFRSQLIDNFSQLASGKSIFLLNLPFDYAGAGMLTRGDYLRILLRPPFCQTDYSQRVKVLEPPDSISPFSYSTAISKILSEGNIGKTMVWRADNTPNVTGSLDSWQLPAYQAAVESIDLKPGTCNFLLENDSDGKREQTDLRLKGLVAERADKWTLEAENYRSLRYSETGLRVRPGLRGLTILFPCRTLSPVITKHVQINLGFLSGKASKLSFVWRSASESEDSGVESRLSGAEIPLNLPSATEKGSITLNLDENSSWSSGSSVGFVGLHLPAGSYELEISGLRLY